MKANKRRLNDSVDLKAFRRVGRVEITVHNITAKQHNENTEKLMLSDISPLNRSGCTNIDAGC